MKKIFLTMMAVALLVTSCGNSGFLGDSFDAQATPLTFEAVSGEVTVTFSFVVTDNDPRIKTEAEPGITVEWSIDDGATWNRGRAEKDSPLIVRGNKILFRGDNSTYRLFQPYTHYSFKKVRDYKTHFSLDADCYVYGNIMSLINSTKYSTLTELSADYTFNHLFERNKHLLSHETKKLVLPATKMTEACYSWMFAQCSNLTTAPDLPATTLENGCYQSMFYRCENLTKAPVLLAKTLKYDCYNGMFLDCKKIDYIKCLATENLNKKCCGGWLSGVAHEGTLVKSSSANWGSLIPVLWTIKEEDN